MSEAFLMINSNCNQNCLFCVTADSKKDISTEKARQIIDYYLKMRYDTLVFTGGEPTIREDLPKLIRYAKEKGFKRIRIQTNGVKISNRQYLENLIESGMNETFVSLHSHKKDVSEELTQLKGSFEKTLHGLENLMQLGVPTRIAVVITSKNYRHLREFVEFIIKKFDITHFEFYLCSPYANAWRNSFINVKLSTVEPYLYEIMKFCKSRNIKFITRSIPLCYLKGFETCSSETISLINKSKPMIINDYKEFKPKNSWEITNSKAPQCKYCWLNEKCGGTWKRYLKLFGNLDLFPQYERIKI